MIRYISELAVTGLTSNPTIFEHAIRSDGCYDDAIREKTLAGKSGEELFFELALEDLRRAADLLRPIHEATTELRNCLGIAIALRAYKAYRDLLASPRRQSLAAAGARPQRLLWASTGTKDPSASDVAYIEALAAPDTIDTMPEATLLAFADHGKASQMMPRDGGAAEAVLRKFARGGVNAATVAAELQRDCAAAFAKSWRDLLSLIAAKSAARAGVAVQGRGA